MQPIQRTPEYTRKKYITHLVHLQSVVEAELTIWLVRPSPVYSFLANKLLVPRFQISFFNATGRNKSPSY